MRQRTTLLTVGFLKDAKEHMKEIGSHLIIDPEICHGQMTFKGTRIPVDTVLSYLAKGYPIDQLVKNWPELTRDAIEEAVHLAANSLQMHYVTGSWSNHVTPVLAA